MRWRHRFRSPSDRRRGSCASGGAADPQRPFRPAAETLAFLASSGRRGAMAVLAALGLVLSLPGALPASDVAVVVRPELPVDNLSFSEMRKLLMGDRQFWSNGVRVTLLMRAPVARERDVVLKTVYQMSETEFRRYWIEKVFRAEAVSGPKIVYSNDTATELVASIPGAVAFVDASQVPKGLKVLKIDGRAPGEKGYPLH